MRDEILREPQSVHETPKNNQKAESRAISDALAKLIERGQNLRNKMLLSTIETPHKFSQRYELCSYDVLIYLLYIDEENYLCTKFLCFVFQFHQNQE